MKGTKPGFTLIEMLVVIAIIAILAGIIFKMMSRARLTAEKAQCIGNLERLASALNEFRAEYGQYPPYVAPPAWRSEVDYVFEDTNLQKGLQTLFNHPEDFTKPNEPCLFYMGLLSYLIPRDPMNWPTNIYWPNGGIPRIGLKHKETYDWGAAQVRTPLKWVPDVKRDLDAKLRWAPFLEGVIGFDNQYTNGYLGMIYNDFYVYARDPWFIGFHYRCDPPYQTYRLWSSGPDRQTNPDNPNDRVNQDDIVVNQMDR